MWIFFVDLFDLSRFPDIPDCRCHSSEKYVLLDYEEKKSINSSIRGGVKKNGTFGWFPPQSN